MPSSKEKNILLTQKNQKNIQTAIKYKEQASSSKNKEYTLKSKKKSKSKINFKKITETEDPDFKSYQNTSMYKELSNKTPSVYLLNAVFLKIFKQSFLNRLISKENEELIKCLCKFTYLKEAKSPIVDQLILHGFNTIYDILLENTESMYLYSFCAHANSIGLIKNPDKFIIDLKKNKLHTDLQKKEVVEFLQLSNLYTRVKRFQL